MKKIKRIILSIAILMMGSNLAKAQLDLETFLEGGITDANTYLSNYLAPVFDGLGFGLNSGWYNTAKPHKLLGFDFTASVSAAIVPDARQLFSFNNADYSNIQLSSDNLTTADVPTLFGENLGADDLPQLTFLDGTTNEEIIRISALTGLGIDEELPFNAVPSAMVQIGIGLPKGTELKLRLVPESITESAFGDSDDAGSAKIFGLGVMHDIKQWLPGEKLLPFDLSAFVGFTNLESRVKLDPDDATSNQFAEFKASTFTFQAIASKKIAFLTPFVGLGFARSSVDFNLLGNYNTDSSTAIPVDPIQLSSSTSGVRANMGLRLKLLFLTLTGEYAFQEFNTVTASIGFSFR